jgi:3-hydroxyisobutyrate dehydrogenase
MLGTPSDVEDVVLSKDGVLNHMQAGKILIDHTTSSPEQAVRINEAARTRGLWFIDAPVSGGDIGAKAGQLVAMVGGEAEIIEKVTEVLRCYSAKIEHMGAVGAG